LPEKQRRGRKQGLGMAYPYRTLLHTLFLCKMLEIWHNLPVPHGMTMPSLLI